jgi:hypothetical protein
MKKFPTFLTALFPFVIALGLWRLSHNVWNPCGILALIPVFYYSFIDVRKYFITFALLISFLLDWNFGTLLFWTMTYSIFFAVNGLQNFIIIKKQKLSGLYIFSGFTGIAFFALGVSGTISIGSARPLATAAWMAAWTILLYLPLSVGFRLIGGGNDRS